MKTTTFLTITAVTVTGVLSVFFSQGALGQASEPSARQSPKPVFVKLADFNLRDGRLVSGRLIEDDKSKVIVEQTEESKLTVATYAKREIDLRTMQTKNVLEWRYYLDLADYFAGRTWDFRDDPDDFIQAIRCCEKAKRILTEGQTSDGERIAEIDARIREMETDRTVWTEQTRSRAEMKGLEFEAEAQKRLEELEIEIKSVAREADKSRIDERENYRKLTKDLADFEKDIISQFDVMAAQIDANTSLLRRIDDYLRWRTWHPWPAPAPQPKP